MAEIVEAIQTDLVPIRVGMILLAFENIRGSFTCPHTRGDDPNFVSDATVFVFLSPYAWG